MVSDGTGIVVVRVKMGQYKVEDDPVISAAGRLFAANGIHFLGSAKFKQGTRRVACHQDIVGPIFCVLFTRCSAPLELCCVEV
jgi:hypothetical protein